MSAISSTSTKLNCYTGYFVPVLTYCSQAWLPNRANMYKIEKVQIMATKRILGNSLQIYKERLISLKLLPLCHYVELHDLLFLAITRNKFDIPTDIKTLEDERTKGNTVELNWKSKITDQSNPKKTSSTERNNYATL